MVFLNPRIDFEDMEDAEKLGISLPSGLAALWKRIEERDNASSSFKLSNAHQVVLDFTLDTAVKKTKKALKQPLPEAQIVTSVVSPILSLLEDLDTLNSEDETGNRNVGVFNM